MQMRAAGATDRGRVRQNNEDAFVADDGLGLYAVADGVGGLESGEIASRIVIESLTNVIAGLHSGTDATPPSGLSRPGNRETSALRSAVSLANKRIFETVARDPAHGGMGTTVTALVMREGMACLAHVGDSRAYRMRDRALAQLTSDHSLVAEMVRAGTLTPKEARKSRHRGVITRAVGINSEIAVDVTTLPVRPGDRFLLCTDGLTDMVPDEEIAAVLARGAPDAAVEALIRKANERGGADNITAVVVDAERTGRGRS
jgi:protein phosphatase